ncbi:triacylglycerol lipase OBL1-like isoform X2 [Mercurialis annua]|uniref:triacylglycerol lipase OBL1-like isoform X2 n=1 Tax=Mercurialis annua TaxID=3986 RepID=UPI00215ED9ED|nr:triacylglycerol lipase OBL1-like isoform X2 [Mercurialis annua]
MLLEPGKTSYIRIVLLLCSYVLGVKSCVLFGNAISENRPQEKGAAEIKWLEYVSLIMQKIFILCREPLALIGDTLEMWLNLLSANGGSFSMLILTILRGKLVWPDRSSATFTSIVGNLDNRVELQKNIKHGKETYSTSYLAFMATKLSYENEAFIRNVVKNSWKMDFLGFFNFYNEYLDEPSTPCFMLRESASDPNLVVVSFRGTNPFDANSWRTNFDISWYELEGIGKIHRGFMKALGLTKHGWSEQIERGIDKRYAYHSIRYSLREALHKNHDAKFILTGHGLGGALALLFVFVLVFHDEDWLLMKLEGVYTFGQPRVGDKQFGEFMKNKMNKYNVKYLRLWRQSQITTTSLCHGLFRST